MHEPYNYRIHKFHLCGQDIEIAAMGGPQYHNEYEGGQAFVMRYLQNNKRTVFIGLNDEDVKGNNAKKLAKENGIEYTDLRVFDYFEIDDQKLHSPLPPEIYDNIYEVVSNAVSQGKQVSIHCGSGLGRSGTALASLKLRELLIQEMLTNPSSFEKDQELSAKTELLSVNDPIECTAQVAKAIELIRESSSGSIELPNDVHTLIEYEKHLRAEIIENKCRYIAAEMLQDIRKDISAEASNKKAVKECIKLAIQFKPEKIEAIITKNKKYLVSIGGKENITLSKSDFMLVQK